MKPIYVLSLIVVSCLLTACGSAGTDVTTDLFLVDIWTDSGLIRVGDPHNLTQRPGYDNQPTWSADGGSIFYASRSGDKADIYRYDLELDEAVRVTDTEDREYSPQEIPGGGGLTAVRLERNNSLRIWRYDADGKNPAPLLASFRDVVRYYQWIDEDTVALGVGNNESELHVAQVGSGDVERVADRVGRSLIKVPGKRAVSFVFKETPADWWIVEVDLDTREVTRHVRTLQGIEDHAWTPSGQLLMGAGTRLYLYAPGRSDGWEEIADFSTTDLTKISRIAVSPDGTQAVLASEVRAKR
jgi:hypothetical protein